MFKSAIFKLSSFYFLLLVLVSAFLSFNWYRVSVREINQVDSSLRRNEDRLSQQPGVGPKVIQDFIERRQEAIESSKAKVANEIILYNIILLTLGGVGAYLLAKRTLEPIEASHNALERFTSDASHELRTPLTAMQLEIETSLRSKKTNAKQMRELAESNLEEVGQMTKLVNNLLTLTRDQPLVCETLDAKVIAKKAVKNIQAMSAKKKIKLKKSVASTKVFVNEPSSVQILTALLDNAVKYAPAGSTIEFSGKKRGKNYVFAIRDSGPGVSKDIKEKIFERFYRADSSRSTDGFGLGLSIAKKLAEQQGSELKLKSSSEKGSVFELCLSSPNRG